MSNALITVQMKDDNDAPKSVLQPIKNTSNLLADLSGYTNGYVPLLDAVTQDQILNVALIVPLALPSGLKTAPVSGSNNDIGALFDYGTSTEDKFAQWYPNFIPAGFIASTPYNVDITQTNVAALIAYLTTALATTVGATEDYVALDSVLSAIKSTRKQRSALRRRHRS